MKWLLIPLFSFFYLEATPSEVMIIRHGEKPRDSNELNLKGLERAAALAPYFSENPPDILVAQRPSDENPAHRCIQTLTPLANQLNFKLHTYPQEEWDKMAEAILTDPAYEGKRVLVCFGHHYIPKIARALGCGSVPDHWDGRVFDRIWTLKYDDGKTTFKNRPQRLLFGDSQN